MNVPSESPAPGATDKDPGSVVVIGAGPAGLTAAYALGKAGHTATVLEATDVVGGISQTVVRDGYRFDIGGHRFFTKVAEVEALWHEILPDEDFMQRPRSSRIYYQGKFFDYPLKPMNALRTLGVLEAVRCALSFFWIRSGRRRTRPPSRATSSPTTAGASTATSSRPTARRCGRCRRRRSRPSGARSASRG